MANPRKRKLAKVAVLLCEQTDSTDVAAQMQAIADGTSIYSTNGGVADASSGPAAIVAANAALTALATDDSGNINPDTGVSRRGSLRFVAGEKSNLLDGNSVVPSQLDEDFLSNGLAGVAPDTARTVNTVAPKFVVADSSADTSDGLLFDNSFTSDHIPALHGQINNTANNIDFTIDPLGSSIPSELAGDNTTQIELVLHADNRGQARSRTSQFAHDLVNGATANAVGSRIDIDKSAGVGDDFGTTFTLSSVAMQITLEDPADATVDANLWAAGDIVRVNTADGSLYDFVAGTDFDHTGVLAAITGDLVLAIDGTAQLDCAADNAPAGQFTVSDVMGQGVDAGVTVQVLRASSLNIVGADESGGGTNTGVTQQGGAAWATDGVGTGAGGAARGAGNFTENVLVNVTQGGAGAGGGAGASFRSAIQAIQLDEFPVRVRYTVTANDLTDESGDRGYAVTWMADTP